MRVSQRPDNRVPCCVHRSCQVRVSQRPDNRVQAARHGGAAGLAAPRALTGEASLLRVHSVIVLLWEELSRHQGLLLPVLRQWRSGRA